MKRIFMAVALVTSLLSVAHAEDTVSKDSTGPAQAITQTEVTSKDSKRIIKIDQNGISISQNADTDSDEPEKFSLLSELVDNLVPIAFFLFLIIAIFGRRYFEARSEDRRLKFLQQMVDKGQPIPESVMKQVMGSDQGPTETSLSAYKRTRNAYGFTIAGFMLLVYGLLNGRLGDSSLMVPGLIFLCLGVGSLMGLYLSKPEEKKTT